MPQPLVAWGPPFPRVALHHQTIIAGAFRASDAAPAGHPHLRAAIERLHAAGAEALDQIERERPDILFLDLVHLAAPALQLTLSHTLSRFPRDSGVLASRQFAADDVQGMEER
ncbi:MAG TPA: hypothetical protein VN750_10440 [Steroidobacteraceae bacterium]|nr:hypothetical protein [Steroidobacteraceae bacterium]